MLASLKKVIFNLEKLGKSLANALSTSLQAFHLHLLGKEALLAAVAVRKCRKMGWEEE